MVERVEVHGGVDAQEPAGDDSGGAPAMRRRPRRVVEDARENERHRDAHCHPEESTRRRARQDEEERDCGKDGVRRAAPAPGGERVRGKRGKEEQRHAASLAHLQRLFEKQEDAGEKEGDSPERCRAGAAAKGEARRVLLRFRRDEARGREEEEEEGGGPDLRTECDEERPREEQEGGRHEKRIQNPPQRRRQWARLGITPEDLTKGARIDGTGSLPALRRGPNLLDALGGHPFPPHGTRIFLCAATMKKSAAAARTAARRSASASAPRISKTGLRTARYAATTARANGSVRFARKPAAATAAATRRSARSQSPQRSPLSPNTPERRPPKTSSRPPFTYTSSKCAFLWRTAAPTPRATNRAPHASASTRRRAGSPAPSEVPVKLTAIPLHAAKEASARESSIFESKRYARNP